MWSCDVLVMSGPIWTHMGRFGIGSLTFYTAPLRHGNAVLGAMLSCYVVLCEGVVEFCLDKHW